MDYLEILKTMVRHASNRGLSRAEFEKRRLDRFRRFAAYIGQYSPYYRRIMRERGIDPVNSSPEQFPILTKSDLMANFDEIVTARDITRHGIEEFLQKSHDWGELYQGRYRVIHTSGSSGMVGYFVYDQKSWSRGMAHVADTPSLGFVPRRWKLAFLGATDGHYAGVTMSGSSRSAPFSFIYRPEFYEVNAPMAKTISGMNALQPDVVIGYGSALAELAEKNMTGVLKISPRMVANSGEPMPPSTRETIEKAFGPCLRNVYSCSEHLVIGVREAGSSLMRLVEDDLMIEIQSDCALITNLFNTTLPLVRYRMNDVLAPVESDVYRPYRAVAEVVGRVEQMAHFVNRHGARDSISPHTINELLIPHVWRFQLRITGESAFTLAMVLHEGSREGQREQAVTAAKERLGKILAQKEMENVRFSIVTVDDIPIDARTGKFKLIVDLSSASVN